MKEIMQLEVNIPKHILKIENGVLTPYEPCPSTNGTMIIYYGQEECGECRINHLYELFPIYEVAEKYGNFDVIPLFSPKPEELVKITELLTTCNFKYPLYLDSNNDFTYANPDFPKEEIFQSLLIDRNGKPVYIGNPVHTMEMWELFKDAVAEMNK